VTVDGDTSTNDMAIVLASGRVRPTRTRSRPRSSASLEELARRIAATARARRRSHDVVRGARDDREARAAAGGDEQQPGEGRVHGRDPNWGRIVSAIGQSGVVADLGRSR
jgi:glutamate N-acetyltransferase / amino-acid N-acetyltransferase